MDEKGRRTTEEVIRAFWETGNFLEALDFQQTQGSSSPASISSQHDHPTMESQVDICSSATPHGQPAELEQFFQEDFAYHTQKCEEIRDAGFDYDVIATMPDDIQSIIHRTAIRRQNSRQNSTSAPPEQQPSASRLEVPGSAFTSSPKGQENCKFEKTFQSESIHRCGFEWSQSIPVCEKGVGSETAQSTSAGVSCSDASPRCLLSQTSLQLHDSVNSVKRSAGKRIFHPKTVIRQPLLESQAPDLRKQKSWEHVHISLEDIRSARKVPEPRHDNVAYSPPRQISRKKASLKKIFCFTNA